VLYFAQSEEHDARREDRERKAQRYNAPITERPCESSPHAAKQAREGEGPQPGCSLAFLLLALLPSSLNANSQADGKGDGKALDEFEGVHGLPCFPHGIAVTRST